MEIKIESIPAKAADGIYTNGQTKIMVEAVHNHAHKERIIFNMQVYKNETNEYMIRAIDTESNKVLEAISNRKTKCGSCWAAVGLLCKTYESLRI